MSVAGMSRRSGRCSIPLPPAISIVFVRYDLVSLGQASIDCRAMQQALRTGFNYNLPRTNKLASLHLEYARNTLSGPAAIVTDARPSDEFRIRLRVSLQHYIRH